MAMNNLFVGTFRMSGQDIDVFVAIERGALTSCYYCSCETATERRVVPIGVSNGKEIDPGDRLWNWAESKARENLFDKRGVCDSCARTHLSEIRKGNVRSWAEYDFDKIVKEKRVGVS
ncbi:MAG: hypothetical protein HYU31_18025 [Deltaproteobacteria bacterium]|nr:hypothetical protein [Deltaproteobacteria bacterium]